MKAIQLQSERLLYLPLSLKHLSHEYVAWMNDEEVNKYLESGGDYTIEKLESFLTDQENKDILFWGIHLKDNNKHIGNIKIDPISYNSGEYGILMGDKTQWGKGYAKEASNTIIDFCFNTLKLKKITLGVIDKNIAAIKLYEKIGFKVYDEIKNKGVYEGTVCSAIRMEKINDK